MHQSENIKIKLITIINKDEYSWLSLLYTWVNENQWLNHGGPGLAKDISSSPKLKFYEETIIESKARTAVVQWKIEA